MTDQNLIKQITDMYVDRNYAKKYAKELESKEKGELLAIYDEMTRESDTR